MSPISSGNGLATGRISGASYMELFRVGYDAVRAYSPNTAVVTAGLAPTGNHEGISVDDRAFLQQMYQAGLAGYTDVKIGIHPYSWGNPPDLLCCDNIEGQGWDDKPQFFFLQTIYDYSNIIAANGDNAPMWVTEFGWATWEGFPNEAPEIWMAYNSASDQRDYALRAFEIGQSRPISSLCFCGISTSPMNWRSSTAANWRPTAYSTRALTAATTRASAPSSTPWRPAPKARQNKNAGHPRHPAYGRNVAGSF